MIHRNEYMANSAELHRAYYSQFVNAGVRNLVKCYIGMEALLKSTDKHLNDIPLAKWDSMVIPHNAKGYVRGTIEDGMLIGYLNGTQMKACGEGGLSLGVGVCILKEAARQLIETA